MGFYSRNSFKKWMGSEVFKPYYTALVKHLESIKDSTTYIKLRSIQDAIIYEEKRGSMKYSQRLSFNLKCLNAGDCHAVFPCRTVEHNSREAGPFQGKNMTLEDMQIRIWQVLRRVKTDNTRRK